MNISQNTDSRKPLRLWPGVAIAVLLASVRLCLTPFFGIIADRDPGRVLGALAILVWWLFFSRAPWPERLGAIVLMVVAMSATSASSTCRLNGGMGLMLYISSIPVLASRWSSGPWPPVACPADPARAMVVAIVLACGVWTLLRTGGISSGGRFGSPLAVDADARRTAPGPGRRRAAGAAARPQRRLPKDRSRPPAGDSLSRAGCRRRRRRPRRRDCRKRPRSASRRRPPASDADSRESNGLAFADRDRDGIVHSVRIDTDWSQSPPVELWRQPIGPGWSSFAVDGDLLYTQEQRGDDEIVAAYRVSTGKPVWQTPRCGPVL